MDCRMDVVLPGMKMTMISLYIHQSAWVTRCIVKEQ